MLALQAERICQVQTFRPPFAAGFVSWLLASFDAAGAPAPDLIIAVGHRTHWPALAARRAHGGKLVVLMRPSLPLSWFDAVVMPQHDAPPTRPQVLATEGVLNPVRAAPVRGAHTLVLIGGPSKHFVWQNDAVLTQLRAIVATLDGPWELADSRRTPAELRTVLRQQFPENFRPVDAMPADWLAARMNDADTIWVSMDSVSMIFEALTAGARVGLLELPASKTTRLVRGIQALVKANRVVTFSAWQAGQPLALLAPLNEAQRCARWLLQRWFAAGDRS